MIQQNIQDITPKSLGLELSSVNHNGSQIYPEMPSGYTPEEVANGVYVYASNGQLYNPDEWKTSMNDSAVGVAVITDNSRFCIKKGLDAVNGIPWSPVLYGTDLTEIASAPNDYKGFNNSVAIRQAASSEDGSNNAAWYCYSQTISINGNTTEGYLPSSGELLDLHNNMESVKSTLSLIGSSIMDNIFETGYFLSSTEYDAEPEFAACRVVLYNGEYYAFSKKQSGASSSYILPFFPILPTFVDLGLPSGTKWATTNLGALTLEQAGYYYQWGDVIGWTAAQVGVDKQFASDYSDYKYYSNGGFTKYNETDGKTTLDETDDVVNLVYGPKYHIPTKEDILELFNNTDIEIINGNNESVILSHEVGSDRYVVKCDKYEQVNAGFKKAIFYNKTDRSKNISFYNFAEAADSTVGVVSGEYCNHTSGTLYGEESMFSLSVGTFILDTTYMERLAVAAWNDIYNFRRKGFQIRGVLKQ